MDDDLITEALLLLFGGVLLGFVGGGGVALWHARYRRGSAAIVPALAVGLMLFALCAGSGAGRVGWAVWEQKQGTVAVTGRLLDHLDVTSTDARTRRTSTLQAPRVEFVAADGSRHVVVGLGGSQTQRTIGDAVPVRYRPEDPRQAVIDDFQNQWGAFWALSGFAGFGLLSGLFFTGTALAELHARASRGRPPGAWAVAVDRWREKHGQGWRRAFTRSAGIAALAGLVVAAIDPLDNFARSLALGFAGICSGLVCCGLAAACTRGSQGSSLGILAIIATGFGFFGFGLWQMSAP